MKLSRERAEAVADSLVKNFKLDSGRVTTKGLSEKQYENLSGGVDIYSVCIIIHLLRLDCRPPCGRCVWLAASSQDQKKIISPIISLNENGGDP